GRRALRGRHIRRIKRGRERHSHRERHMSDMHGKFVWIELMTSDPKAAEGFYSKVVGWSAKDSGQPGMSYTLLSMGEMMMGGLMAIPEEAKKMGARPI